MRGKKRNEKSRIYYSRDCEGCVMTCELCVDCDDIGCSGKECFKKGSCIIIDSCFKECEGIGGFIGKIPIFDIGG